MKIALLWPPLGALTYPYGSLPYLTGYLRSLGHEVTQLDLGIRVMDRMLTPSFLAEIGRLVKDELRGREDAGVAARGKAGGRRSLLSIDQFGDDVIGKILEAKAILRDPERFYRPEAYRYAAMVIVRALEMISAVSFPTELRNQRLHFPEPWTLPNLYALAADRRRNPFYQPMRALLAEAISSRPDLVGISVAYGDQILGAFALAMLAKARFPSVPVVMGGPLITYAESLLRRDPRAFAWVDGYVFGEGEWALAELADALVAGGRIEEDDPHALVRPAAGQSVRVSPRSPEERRKRDINLLPGPDYDGLNLEDYLSPEIVFTLSNARGCYWNQCGFCGVDLSYKGAYRPRSFERLRADLDRLRQNQGARFFAFADDAIPPARCLELADYFGDGAGPVAWLTMVRYEERFDRATLKRMRAGGCRLLSFGNESGCQRVLDLIRKGTTVDTARRVLADVAAVGIGAHLHSFFGFPGETLAEARQTMDFLVEIKDHVTSNTVGLFELVEFSPVQRDPAAFGVTIHRVQRQDELVPTFSFTAEGATREQARATLERCLQATRRIWPGQELLLDGPYGAHILLCLEHYDQTKLDPVFPARETPERIKEKRPLLRPRTRVSADGALGAFLYDPETAEQAYLTPDQLRGLKWMDGKCSVAELERGLIAREGRESGLLSALLFVSTVYDLYRGGFVDFVDAPKDAPGRGS